MDNKIYQTEKIAIIIATYNGERYLAEQLESLRNQTYQDWVAYIHDDNSSDATKEIITKYVAEYPEHFIEIQGESTGSAKNNFFYLMSRVDAPYMMCCDQDDVWMPNKIQITFETMKNIEAEGEMELPCLVFTELQVVDERLRVIADRMSTVQQLDCKRVETKDFVLQNSVTGCTMMINRALLKMATREADRKAIIMHDWWCALIAAEYGKIQFIEESTIHYRQHGDNSVGAKNVVSLRYIINKARKVYEIEESLELTRQQAREFEKVFGLKSTDVISQYGHIKEYRKRKRMQFYKANGMRKSGFARNVGFAIWG